MVKYDWSKKPEQWNRIPMFVGYQISSYGNLRDPNQNPVEMYFNDKDQWCAHLITDEWESWAPVWKHLLVSFFDGNLDDVYFLYRDGDIANLALDNLIPVYMGEDGKPVELKSRARFLGRIVLDRRIKNTNKAVMIIETGDVFDTVKECAQAIDGYTNMIHKCLKGTAESHHGYHFRYIDKY
jgi:hypothetical protein